MTHPFILGEFRRTLDDRFRLSIPTELAQPLVEAGGQCILVKERAGSLSLWSSSVWQDRLDRGIQLIQSKLEAGRLEDRIDDPRGISRSPRRGTGRRDLGTRSSTLHRDMAAASLDRLSGRVDAGIPSNFRWLVRLTVPYVFPVHSRKRWPSPGYRSEVITAHRY